MTPKPPCGCPSVYYESWPDNKTTWYYKVEGGYSTKTQHHSLNLVSRYGGRPFPTLQAARNHHHRCWESRCRKASS